MSMKEQVKLSRVPSVVITEALDDLIKCERSDKYLIDMGTWYAPDYYTAEDNFERSKCAICLAGAVMAKRLGNGDKERSPKNYRGNNRGVLYALDHFRCGDVHRGFKSLNLSRYWVGTKFNRVIVNYSDDPGKFKRDMRKLSRDLAEAGF